MKPKYFAFFLLILAWIWFSSYSIMQTRLFQLNLYVEKQKVHNYELSNRVLSNKFHQMLRMKYRNDIERDIRLRVLESQILENNSHLPKNLNKFNSIDTLLGRLIVNATRLSLFKPTLQFDHDLKVISHLRYAFFLEKIKLYAEAAKEFTLLEKKLKDPYSQDFAFVLLHGGFCQIFSGNSELANKKLRLVIKRFSGTSYETTAILMIRLLHESLNEKKKILKEISPRRKGLALYRNGFFKDATRELLKLTSRTETEQLILLRSFEESGRINEAIQGYIKVIQKSNNINNKMQANRRLLLIARFQQDNEKNLQLTKKMAVKLKDKRLMNVTKKYIKFYRPPNMILEQTNIEKGDEQKHIDIKKHYIQYGENLNKAFSGLTRLYKNTAKNRKRTVKIAPRKGDARQTTYHMQLLLKDGRNINITQIHQSKNIFNIITAGFTSKIESEQIKEIRVITKRNEIVEKTSDASLILYLKGGRKIILKRISISKGNIILPGGAKVELQNLLKVVLARRPF